MPRIISGAAGGTVLAVPGTGTRPTGDRVRESLFSALESAGLIEGARCADLYAGSGALGLEALSRGAASVVLVERSNAAARIIEQNAARVQSRVAGEASVVVRRSAVASAVRAGLGPVDLVFLDPPYDLPGHEITGVLTDLVPQLSEDGLIVLERSSRSGAPDLPDDLIVERERRYGDTTLWWLRPGDQPRAESQSR